MRIHNVFILNGLSVVVKILTLLGLNKIFAIYLGASGYALIGQVQNILNIAMIAPSQAICTSVVKYTAEYKNGEREKIGLVWFNAFVLSTILGVVITFVIFIFKDTIVVRFFNSNSSTGIAIYFLGASVVLYAWNNLILSMLNGLSYIKQYIWLNIISSFVSAIYALILTLAFGIVGALVAVVSNQAILLFLTFFYSRKILKEYIVKAVCYLDVKTQKRMFSFSLMTISSAILLPVSTVFVRNEIIEFVSIDYAGMWDAMNKISTVYLMLITTTLGVYFFPRFSATKNRKELLTELKVCYAYLMPIVILSSIFMYAFRWGITELLFTKEFIPLVLVYKYQLFGDFFKIAAWVLGYLLISKALVKEYIILEVAQWGIYCFLSKYVLCRYEYYGFDGVFKAYILTQLVYFLLLFITVVYLFHRKKI